MSRIANKTEFSSGPQGRLNGGRIRPAHSSSGTMGWQYRRSLLTMMLTVFGLSCNSPTLIAQQAGQPYPDRIRSQFLEACPTSPAFANLTGFDPATICVDILENFEEHIAYTEFTKVYGGFAELRPGWRPQQPQDDRNGKYALLVQLLDIQNGVLKKNFLDGVDETCRKPQAANEKSRDALCSCIRSNLDKKNTWSTIVSRSSKDRLHKHVMDISSLCAKTLNINATTEKPATNPDPTPRPEDTQ